MGIPDHLTCLLRNLYAGQEATVRTWHRTTDCFKIGKGLQQTGIFSPCLFNFYAEYIIWDAGLDDSQAVIKISGRNINNLRYADDTRNWRGTKEPLDEGERGEWKNWLKMQHSKNEDHWESHFLGRLIISLGVPRREGSGILKEEERTNFFVPLHSLGLYNNNVSCLRTVSGKNLLANPVILKCKFWE